LAARGKLKIVLLQTNLVIFVASCKALLVFSLVARGRRALWLRGKLACNTPKKEKKKRIKEMLYSPYQESFADGAICCIPAYVKRSFKNHYLPGSVKCALTLEKCAVRDVYFSFFFSFFFRSASALLIVFVCVGRVRG